MVGRKVEITSVSGDVLGIPPPRVRVIFKDGVVAVVGGGSGGSMSIAVDAMVAQTAVARCELELGDTSV